MEWSQITISQYQELEKTFKEEPTELDEIFELSVRRAIILTGMSNEEVDKLTLDEITEINSILKKPTPQKMVKYFRLGKHLYKTILNPAKESSFGRYMAVMNSAKSDDYARIIFNAVIPIKNIWGKKLELTPIEIEERIKEFKELPVTIGLPIKLFFCSLTTELTNATLQYSDEVLMKMKKQMEQQATSLKDLVGQ